MQVAVDPFMQKYGSRAPVTVYAQSPSLTIGAAKDWGSYFFWNIVYAVMPFTLKHWVLFLFSFLFTVFVFDALVLKIDISELSFRAMLLHSFVTYVIVSLVAHWKRQPNA